MVEMYLARALDVFARKWENTDRERKFERHTDESDCKWDTYVSPLTLNGGRIAKIRQVLVQ